MKRKNKVTSALIALIATFEGVSYYAYRDPVGIPTICFGETRGVKMGMKATPEQCDAKLKQRLVEFETDLRNCMPIDSVSDNPYMAIMSLSYNVGSNRVCNSSIGKYVKQGNIPSACNEFSKWVYAKGIKLPGLVRRRTEEKELCLS